MDAPAGATAQVARRFPGIRPTLFQFPSTSRTAVARAFGETLAVATAGGGALGLTGFPAGWLSGAILAVAAAAIAGRPMLLPVLFTRAVFVLIGISLGSVVTPETLHGMATYPLSIAALIVAMACIGLAGAAYLRFVHGWDKVAAYLAAAPGGMSQVIGARGRSRRRPPRRCDRAEHPSGDRGRRFAGGAVAVRACRPCRAPRQRTSRLSRSPTRWLCWWSPPASAA